ncbi:hypothetical protein AB2S17_01280 [Escherichia coli]|uniref:hypothetical protein n=1 Tax=Escherichia coli TaxID=562 RepID=UPI0018943FAF|nr:hypothetical protein [Escherichia coli]HAP2672829.1 hypothetical protein [Escherichia coli]HDQ0689446.1 hypothetical protein [Escherichia coli]HDQ0695175.1 hypothetical protein [Escherichia coli]
MECKLSELVKRGHDQAAELKSSCGAVDVRDVAQLISDLATQLDVQLARSNALVADNAGLKDALAAVIDRSNEPDYQSIGMGCGVEDNGLQTDGYNACEYGWREAMERIYSEVIPEELPETPATDAYRDELRAQGIEMAAKSDQFSMWVQQGLRSFAIGVRQGDEK